MSKDPRLILLPVDDSPHSERAFDWYLQHLHRQDDQLGIVHFHQAPQPTAEKYGVLSVGLVDDSDKFKEEMKASLQKSKKLIEKYEKKAKESGIKSETLLTSSVHGPGAGICDLAEKRNAAGIVMGSRGLNLLRRTFLGSVSSYVINHANTAVTITPPEKNLSVSSGHTDESEILT